MSNHYHLVVKLRPDDPKTWSDADVLERWTTLFKGPLLVQRYCNQQPLSAAERTTLMDLIKVYRKRLGSLSWFMKCLNEPIARQANAEDECTGHFWEARFVSQALYSEQALVAAMAYVDLNPIRAGMAQTPQQSLHTSLRARLMPRKSSEQLRRAITMMEDSGQLRRTLKKIASLAVFADQTSWKQRRNELPIHYTDYLSLIASVGKNAAQIRRQRLESSLTPVLERLEMTKDEWLKSCSDFHAYYEMTGRRTKKTV